MSLILDFRGNPINCNKIIGKIYHDQSTYSYNPIADGPLLSPEQNLLAVENAVLVYSYQTVIFNGSALGCYFPAYNLVRYRLLRKGHAYWMVCVHPLGYESKEHRKSAEAAGWDIMDIDI